MTESAGSALGSTLLQAAGLSCGQIVALAVGALVLHCVCLFFGARLAGLRASFGRAVLALLLTLGLMIPAAIVFRLLAVGLGQTAQAVVSQLAVAVAEILAIKLVYGTAFGRATFAYLATSIFTTAGLVPLLMVIF